MPERSPAICGEPGPNLPPGVSDRLEWARLETLNDFFHLSTNAETTLVPEPSLVKIGKDMPPGRASLIGCGVLPGFGAATRTANVWSRRHRRGGPHHGGDKIANRP